MFVPVFMHLALGGGASGGRQETPGTRCPLTHGLSASPKTQPAELPQQALGPPHGGRKGFKNPNEREVAGVV